MRIIIAKRVFREKQEYELALAFGDLASGFEKNTNDMHREIEIANEIDVEREMLDMAQKTAASTFEGSWATYWKYEVGQFIWPKIKRREYPEALIFHCDGTVLDTLTLFWRACLGTCKAFDIAVTKRRFYELATFSSRRIYKQLLEDAGIVDTSLVTSMIEQETKFVNALKKLQQQKYNAEDQNVGTEALTWCSEIKVVADIVRNSIGTIPMAIVSSRQRIHVEEALQMNNILNAFDAIICLEDLDYAVAQ